MRPWGGIALATILVALAIAAPSAGAASTRAEYVAQTDPICLAAATSEQAMIGPLKKLDRRLRKRGIDTDHPPKWVRRKVVRTYDQVIAIDKDSINQLTMVAPAPGDADPVSRWLQGRNLSDDLFQLGVHAYGRGNQHRANALIDRSFLIQEDADFQVREFPFRYCVPDVA